MRLRNVCEVIFKTAVKVTYCMRIVLANKICCFDDSLSCLQTAFHCFWTNALSAGVQHVSAAIPNEDWTYVHWTLHARTINQKMWLRSIALRGCYVECTLGHCKEHNVSIHTEHETIYIRPVMYVGCGVFMCCISTPCSSRQAVFYGCVARLSTRALSHKQSFDRSVA